MAHLLLIEVPGGNDFTVLEDAVDLGHQVTFFTADLAHYRKQGEATQRRLALAREIIDVQPFDYAEFERRACLVHSSHPFDAVLCLIDIRLVEASLIAEKLGLRFLNPATTRMMRDKFSVRQRLATREVRQPGFAVAETAGELRQAVAEIGYPVLVKPSDGYGSQNVSVVFSEADLSKLTDALEALTLKPTDYGLGVRAGNRFSVEEYVRGHMIGCDVFSNKTERVFLGINDKLMFPPPSFAMRGSCFPSDRYDVSAIEQYAFEILDAVNFDFGACHIEMIVARDGPYLVEVNPRLVSAQIPHQMGYALERSIYADLINLHLGLPIASLRDLKRHWFSAIRWFTADRPGILASIQLPEDLDEAIRRVVLFKESGDALRPPVHNGDRIGYVIAVGNTQAAAEAVADRCVGDTRIIFE
jgi:biotin carboxylase